MIWIIINNYILIQVNSTVSISSCWDIRSSSKAPKKSTGNLIHVAAFTSLVPSPAAIEARFYII